MAIPPVRDRRIRARAADHAREQTRQMESELQHYRGEFYGNEVRTMREIIAAFKRLAAQIDAADVMHKQDRSA